jgi:hypothetical protein
MDKTGTKLWALYPWQQNNEAYRRTTNSIARYSECEKELVGGVYVLTLPGEAIKLPPGCLHWTFTVRSGSLFGSTFAAGEGAVIAAEILKHDILTDGVTSLSHMQPFLQCLHAAVIARMKDWRIALGTLCDINSSHFNGKKREKVMLDIIKKIRLCLSQELSEPCQRCKKMVGTHFPLSLGLSGTKAKAQHGHPGRGG